MNIRLHLLLRSGLALPKAVIQTCGLGEGCGLHKLLRVAAQLFLRCNATLGYGCVRASLKRVRNCGTYSGDWGPILKRGRNCGTTLGTVVLS